MKKLLTILAVASFAVLSLAEITYDYQGQGGVFDGTNLVDVALNDSGIDFLMTVLGTGGDLNSNSGGIGIGDDQIDGTSEIITISFDTAIDFVSIDLGAVGTTVADGARLTIGAQSPIDLYTGVSGFNGTTKVYAPALAIRVNAGELIVLTSSSTTSSFDLERMTVVAVPEPATLGMISLGGLLTMIIRRMSRA